MTDDLKARSTINRQIRLLRAVIEDESESPEAQRIAQAMEHALRWVTLKTSCWGPMDREAREFACFLQSDRGLT